MQNFKRTVGLWLLALFALPSTFAFENGADDWALNRTDKSVQEHRRVPADPLEFSRIQETGNDNALHYAVDSDAALISAAEQNDLLGVETLLKNGADANARDAVGNRPLLHAARLGARRWCVCCWRREPIPT